MSDSKQLFPPIDRFCDLVMKGGITSSIVYPKAIAKLSRRYRFQSIGGTSAGAIAAAVTAAAELQRRNGSEAGFVLLESLPEKLQALQPDTKNSKLLSLFQPERETHRLFAILLSSLNSQGTWRRVFAIATGIIRAYWPAVIVSFAAALAVWFVKLGSLGAVLVFLFILGVLLSLWLYRDITRNVSSNGFGLCTGMSAGEPEALTPWLHRIIQEAAGLLPDAAPLTFGQLWDAKDPPNPPIMDTKVVRPKSIDLQMFSTNLTHGRPYILPFSVTDPEGSRFRASERFFFKESELQRYLPKDVVKWMVKHSTPYRVEVGREHKDPPIDEKTRDLLELPSAKDLPVLLAARMSLSFPFLFSAIPLWAIDYEMPSKHGRRVKCCWFSDGGICSNFPIHLFDGLVPSWPTFGFSLEGKIDNRPMRYLPARYEEGYGERWNGFADKEKYASRFGGFLSAIVVTMQNWNDNTLAKMPGVRDRVARVRLEPHEGGINLNMSQKDMAAISSRGAQAAADLIDRFAMKIEGVPATGWDDHRGIRLNVLLCMLGARARGVRNALHNSITSATTYQELINEAAKEGKFSGFEEKFSEEDAIYLKEVLSKLDSFMETLSRPQPVNRFRPIPIAEIRVRPPL